MRKFRQIICMMVVFILCTLTIAGCALFERDEEYFRNMTVAQVGPNIRITKIQLITGFNNFGGQFLQQGMSREEAFDEVLNILIDREIMVELSVQNFSEFFTRPQVGPPVLIEGQARVNHINHLRNQTGFNGLFYLALNDEERAEARRDTFAAMDANFATIEERVRRERGQQGSITPGTPTPPSEPVATFEPFTPFQPHLVNNGGRLEIDVSAFATRESLAGTVPYTWTHTMRGAQSDDPGVEAVIARETMARFVLTLRNAERGLRFSSSNNTDEAVIGREVDRLLEIFTKNMLTRRFRDSFDQGLDRPITRLEIEYQKENHNMTTFETAYIAAVRARWSATGIIDPNEPNQIWESDRVRTLRAQASQVFQARVRSQIQSFRWGFTGSDEIRNNASQIGGLANILWMPDEYIDDFFTVSHILVSYSDEQNAQIAALRTKMSQGGANEQDMQELLNGFRGSVSTERRDELGRPIEGVTRTAVQILQELESALVGGLEAQPWLSEQQRQDRISTFRDFIYMYGMDPGMINPEFEYVMSTREYVMVPEFTTASRELFGYVYDAVLDELGLPMFDEEGNPMTEWRRRDNRGNILETRTSVSDIVMTDHGAHIIMFTRTLRCFIPTTEEWTGSNDHLTWLMKPLTSYGNSFTGIRVAENGSETFNTIHAPARTRFDAIVETLRRPSLDEFERNTVATFKQQLESQGHAIRIYRRNFRDLF